MKRHPRRSNEEWLNLIHECRTSGLSDKTWCVENAIQPSNFYYHIRRLRNMACEIPERACTKISLPKQTVVPIPFSDSKPFDALANTEDQYANLPIKEILVKVPESERYCDWCNAEMVRMKSAFVREEIRITPAVVERIHYMQEVLICPECKKDHYGSYKKGDVPSALLPHSPASASAVAFVMFSKGFMGLPYYRQESAFEQLGATIPRETLANWCILSSERTFFQSMSGFTKNC